MSDSECDDDDGEASFDGVTLSTACSLSRLSTLYALQDWLNKVSSGLKSLLHFFRFFLGDELLSLLLELISETLDVFSDKGESGRDGGVLLSSGFSFLHTAA